MKYRFLGSSGIRVSEICFGVMTFGGTGKWKQMGSQNLQQAKELVDIAYDRGVNFFDTADVYSEGESEKILGQALKGKRKNTIIATKCGFRMNPDPNGDGLSRKRIIEACEASLKRLGTDYIDLYQIHSYDFVTPLQETLGTLDLLVKQGKIRYIGCSNFTGWQLIKAISICDIFSWEKFVSLQAYYSLVGRDLELELVPACLDQGLGILPWGPLHGGFLTGKYRSNRWPEGTRIRSMEDLLPLDIEKGYRIIDTCLRISEKRRVSVPQIALNYLLRKTGVTSVVIGARTKQQLLDDLAACDWELSVEEMDELNKVSAPPKIYPIWYFDIFRKDRLNRDMINPCE